jgi:twitching motility protein PilI
MAVNREPFELLEDIASRTRANSKGLPAQQEVKATWSGIGFMMGGQRYVTPIKEVAEVLEEPHYTRLPGVKNWVKGVANVRGRLVPIMDLMGFFDSASIAHSRNNRLLVVSYNGILSGLIVEDVLGMQHFLADTYRDTTSANIPEKVKRFVSGSYKRNQEEWVLFSLFKLAEDADFLQVASA